MTPKNRYHGGLQFSGEDEGALTRLSEIVAATLEDYGHLVERKNILSKTEASIVSSQYLVRLCLDTNMFEPKDRHECLDRAAGLKTETHAPQGRNRNRLVISMAPVSELLDDSEVSELMLVVMLYRMVDICSSQRVEWLSPNTVLTIEQFMSAFDSLTPSRQRNRKQIFETVNGPFAGAEVPSQPEPETDTPAVIRDTVRPIKLTDEQLLSIAFRKDAEEHQEEPDDGKLQRDIQRLTSWGMTGVVASLSAPVALSMAAVNLIRGEDFRLNTQVLAYTAAIVMLQTSGALADVSAALGM